MRLKRCPFCGDLPTKRVAIRAAAENVHLIACENELCAAQPCVSDTWETKAVQKWNMRAL